MSNPNPWYQASKGRPRRLLSIARPQWMDEAGIRFAAPYWHTAKDQEPMAIYENPNGRHHTCKLSTWTHWVKKAEIMETSP